MTTKELVLALGLGFCTQISLYAQGTAFTYQGRLNSSGSPANGLFDYRFRLDADPLGNTILATVTTNAIGVTNGLFTTTIDFGPGWFSGTNYWLEIDMRTNGAGGYDELYPLQVLTPMPYAIFATTASNVSGTVSAAQLSGAVASGNLPSSPIVSGTVTAGAFTGNGANVTSVNAATLNGLNSSSFWKLGGNTVAAGQFLGSINNQPVEIWVNNERVLRLEQEFSLVGAPNVIGGAVGNSVASGVYGATISGGGATNYNGGGNGYIFTNSVASTFSTIGGGKGNMIQANSDNSTIPGGVLNQIQPYAVVSTIGGGYSNQILAGANFTISAEGATIGGGELNQIQGSAHGATIPGGANNIAGGPYAFAAGQQAQALHQGTFVWADSQDAAFSSTANDQFLIRAQGGVGIGVNNPAQSLDVGGRVRLRQESGGNSAGLFLYQNTPANDRAFIGMVSDGYVGLWGNIAYSWGLVMNVTNNHVGIVNLTPTHLLHVGNAYCDGNQWYPSSDRNVKSGFETISPRTVLDKVAALPSTRWHYTNDVATTHLGPMAQDFYAAFQVGPDDRHISTLDEGSVALAAIQGLNEKVESGKQAAETQMEQLAAENAELKQRLAALEKIILNQKPN